MPMVGLAGTDRDRTGQRDNPSHRDRDEPRQGEGRLVVLTAYIEAIYLDLQSAFDYYDRAVQSYQAKRYDRAMSLVNQTIRLEPGSSLADSLRGDIWLAKKVTDKALADCKEAIRLDPQNGYAHEHTFPCLVRHEGVRQVDGRGERGHPASS